MIRKRSIGRLHKCKLKISYRKNLFPYKREFKEGDDLIRGFYKLSELTVIFEKNVDYFSFVTLRVLKVGIY